MCTNCSVTINQTQSNAFAEKMLTILNHGALGLMTSIGYRTGLFDTMAAMEPSSSHQIARQAGLSERYVREWLGTMVTGQIVEYDPQEKTYYLPAEHATWLTRQSSPNNIAVTAQWLTVMGSVEDRIVESFKNGGGLHYNEYKRFHEVMADERNQTVVAPLLDKLLPLVPGLKEKLERGIHVLDLGCGSGRALITLAREFPQSNFTGYDFSPEAIENAMILASQEGLCNVAFAVRDIAKITDFEGFDLVCTFDAVHDQARPDAVLKNIYRALKPGGLYFCQDIAGSSHLEKNMDHPVAPLMYAISCTHCMSVSLGQNGAGLGAMWGQELACEMMRKAGFSNIEVRHLEHDFMKLLVFTHEASFNSSAKSAEANPRRFASQSEHAGIDPPFLDPVLTPRV